MRNCLPRARSQHALMLAALATGSAVVATASAADAPPLPVDFLEYLGSWEADDADWLVATAAAVASVPTAAVPAASHSNPTPTAKRGVAHSPAPAEHKP